MKTQKSTINTLTELNKVAKELVESSETPNTLLLSGKLGSGKTTFAKAFMSYLGFNPNLVKSPTFSLINKYKTENNKNYFHVDLYRLESLDPIIFNEIEEIISDSSNSILIEWPEILLENKSLFKNRNYYHLTFDYLPGGDRTLEIEIKSN